MAAGLFKVVLIKAASDAVEPAGPWAELVNGPVSPCSAYGLAEMSPLICRLKRSDHPTLRAAGMQSAAIVKRV